MPYRKFALLLLLTCLFLTACQPVAPTEKRPGGKTITAAAEETIHTAFFAYSVDQVLVSRTLHNYLPQAEDALLLSLDLTVRNEGEEIVPMDYSDFLLLWQEGDQTVSAYPLQLFCDTQFPDSYRLAASEQRSGQLIYQVPKTIDRFILRYQEVYADDYLGNIYEVLLTLPD
ncbi:MAG: DUF4352 domain-containing protein [Negativicutes bacterium]|nr:DUF4352 domain-containing protein [Negativicutes bacterium]